MMARFPAVMASWSRGLPTVVDTDAQGAGPGAAQCHSGGASRHARRPPSRSSATIPTRKRNFVLQTIEGGGWGARPYEDGESASVSVCQGDVRNAPIETIELKTPVHRREAARCAKTSAAPESIAAGSAS